jgi:hypothetical protein
MEAGPIIDEAAGTLPELDDRYRPADTDPKGDMAKVMAAFATVNCALAGMEPEAFGGDILERLRKFFEKALDVLFKIMEKLAGCSCTVAFTGLLPSVSVTFAAPR